MTKAYLVEIETWGLTGAAMYKDRRLVLQEVQVQLQKGLKHGEKIIIRRADDDNYDA